MASPFDVALPYLLVFAGFGLMLAEALAPGAHFIVLGIALLVAGLVGVLVPALANAIALAVIVLVVGALTLVGYRELDFYGGRGAGRTSDSDSLTGQRGRVTERVTAAGGEVKLDDGGFNPYYRARAMSGEIDEGTEVIVVDPGGGNVLTVESLAGLDEIDRELARGQSAERETERETDSEPGTG